MRNTETRHHAFLALPDRLRDLIEQSLEFMHADPDHMLNFGYRYAIYAAMGSEYPSRPKVDVIGHKRRAYLNILTAEYALPVWNTSLARNASWKSFTGYPQDLLEAARDILFEGIATATNKWLDQKRSSHLVSRVHQRQSNIHNNEDKWLGVFSLHDFDALRIPRSQKDYFALQGVGISAVNALQVSLWDDDYIYEETNFLITEDMGDYYDWDGAYYAMCGLSYWSSKSSDKFKRKSFWEWWLLEAIPQAYTRF